MVVQSYNPLLRVFPLLVVCFDSFDVILPQSFPSDEGWPFAKYLGACGRMVAVNYVGEELWSFYNAPWEKRVDLAWQLMEIAEQLTNNDFEFALYLLDVSFDNFAVGPRDGKVIIVDAENVLVADKKLIKQMIWCPVHGGESPPPGVPSAHDPLTSRMVGIAKCGKDEEVIPGALCRQRSPGGIQIIWPGSWDQTYVHSLSLLPSPPTRDSFATIPRLRGDKEPTSGSKTKTTRKCAVCMKKLSSSYKKSLCKECTDKIISEERPSLIEEIKTLIQQEIKTSLATLSLSLHHLLVPLLRLRKGNLIHRRKSRRTLRERRRTNPPEEGELSLDSETVQQERYYFSSSDIEELLTAVRKTMEVEEEKTAQSVQEEMFGGLRSRKRQVFPIHQNIRDLVLDEWESPEKKLTTPAEIKDRFPVDAETASCWSEVPKVDVQIARVAKKTTLPFEDASQLRDPSGT
ncbi:unnamed protein product [Ranitomeya imitator]|uniref:FAM69 protein-kinase domain-containing protein n=1 Tax=Ranitomeya imitator TaxID=111125 RepID=A0ABN9M2K8_9NEOB|nr:unnamed protein product [Ranitomeya imitator]